MRAQVQLSTKFLTTQNAHQVGILTTLSGGRPAIPGPDQRDPGLDRSGSMSGAPLAAAIEAAQRFAGFLGENDRLGVVAFDDEVRVIARRPPAEIPRFATPSADSRRRQHQPLGWMAQGVRARPAGLVDGVNRIVLLTDGQANAGLTDSGALAAMVRSGAESGVSTTSIGFGAGFNEDLLQALGREGRGTTGTWSTTTR